MKQRLKRMQMQFSVFMKRGKGKKIQNLNSNQAEIRGSANNNIRGSTKHKKQPEQQKQ